jgi:hypothetical protein
MTMRLAITLRSPVRRRVKPWRAGIGRRRFAVALVLDSPAKGRPYGELL